MNFLELVNQLLTETSVADPVETIEGVDPNSDVGRAVTAIRSAQRDLSRKIPQGPLKRTGSISTVASVSLADKFSDMTGDGTIDNGLVVVTGSSTVSGTSDNQLQVDTSWVGRLFHVDGSPLIYRIKGVDVIAKTFTLADLAMNEAAWVSTTVFSRDSAGVAVDPTDPWSASSTYAIGRVAQDRYLLPEDYKALDTSNTFSCFGSLSVVSVAEFESARWQGGVPWILDEPEIVVVRDPTTVNGKMRYYIELFPIPQFNTVLPFRYEAEPTLLEKDEDVVSYDGISLMGLLARARWYIYRFVKKSLDDAQVEEGTWRDILADQVKAPGTSTDMPRIQPVTHRDFWESAYDG